MSITGPFYIVLPSNSSTNIYPNNTVTSFRVKLAHPLVLNGLWEVALSEIQYPRTWHNISETGSKSKLYILGRPIEFDIDEAYYNTPEELCSALNSAIQNSVNTIRYMYRDVSEYLAHDKTRYGNIVCQFTVTHQKKKVVLYLKGKVILDISDELKILLGFEKNQLTPKYDSSNLAEAEYKMYSIHAENYCDIMQSRFAIYVYTDIIENQIVGHSSVPLLRVVPVEGIHGQVVTKTYVHPQYIPLNTTYVSEIQILFRDDIGAPIPFSRGKSNVTLHFRKRLEY